MKHLSDKKRHRVREHFYINSRCCAKLAAVALTAGLTLAGGLIVQASDSTDCNNTNGIGIIPNAEDYENIYGWYKDKENEAAEGGNIIVSGKYMNDYYRLNIYGGYSKLGNASNNTVCYTGETRNLYVYGGYSGGEGVTVSNNTVTFDSPYKEFVQGGGGYIYGSGVVENNHIYVTEHTEVNIVNGGMIGGPINRPMGDKFVKNNTATIWGVTNYAYGGRASFDNSKGGKITVTGNILDIKSSASVYHCAAGGYSESFGSDADVRNNTVYVSSNSHVNDRLYGGYTAAGGTVSGNQIFIYEDGRDFGYHSDKLDIYAGYSNNKSGTVYDNTITLHGKFSFVGNVNLYGSNQSAEKTTGNTLVVDGWSGSFDSAQNFNLISFRNTKWAADSNVMNIEEGVSNALEHTQVKLENLVIDRNTVVNPGDSMTIIKSNVDTGLSMDNVESSAVFSQGVAKLGRESSV